MLIKAYQVNLTCFTVARNELSALATNELLQRLSSGDQSQQGLLIPFHLTKFVHWSPWFYLAYRLARPWRMASNAIAVCSVSSSNKTASVLAVVRCRRGAAVLCAIGCAWKQGKNLQWLRGGDLRQVVDGCCRSVVLGAFPDIFNG